MDLARSEDTGGGWSAGVILRRRTLHLLEYEQRGIAIEDWQLALAK